MSDARRRRVVVESMLQDNGRRVFDKVRFYMGEDCYGLKHADDDVQVRTWRDAWLEGRVDNVADLLYQSPFWRASS